MEANADQGDRLPDGVLVVRAVSRGDAGGRVFRVTMGAGGETDPEVVVVSDVDELHRSIDDWVSGLTR
ncbi:MAG TPA: hypothetical protein VFL69_04585 [Marmoricola sp.]|nr:hypothetical protein [Marmoricola sp.]